MPDEIPGPESQKNAQSPEAATLETLINDVAGLRVGIANSKMRSEQLVELWTLLEARTRELEARHASGEPTSVTPGDLRQMLTRLANLADPAFKRPRAEYANLRRALLKFEERIASPPRPRLRETIANPFLDPDFAARFVTIYRDTKTTRYAMYEELQKTFTPILGKAPVDPGTIGNWLRSYYALKGPRDKQEGVGLDDMIKHLLIEHGIPKGEAQLLIDERNALNRETQHEKFRASYADTRKRLGLNKDDNGPADDSEDE